MAYHLCERCGKKITPGHQVWLELDWTTNLYQPLGVVKAEHSQGCFIFGPACAKHPNKPYKTA